MYPRQLTAGQSGFGMPSRTSREVGWTLGLLGYVDETASMQLVKSSGVCLIKSTVEEIRCAVSRYAVDTVSMFELRN